MLAQIRDPFEVVGVFFAIGITAISLYVGFLGARWLHRRLEAPKLPERADLDQLHDRLDRLEETEARLAEVEERLDFTERMLASEGKAPVALPRGKGE